MPLRVAEWLARSVTLLSIGYVPRLRAWGPEPRQEGTSLRMENWMPIKQKHFEKILRDNNLRSFAEQGFTTCVNGQAGEFPCSEIDLAYFLPHSSMCATEGNDVWGWTDPTTDQEYILAGQFEQTTVVEIIAGELVPIAAISHSNSFWSDIKVYSNHMYIGSEAAIGIQVYDLTQLRTLEREPCRIVSLTPDSVYNEGMTSHNVVINEESGHMYVVGSSSCNSGLHIVDIRNPSSPTFVACYSDDGYVHDAECVIYIGPDTRYQSREICFCYNEDTLTIVDVHDKSNIRLLSRTGYTGRAYTHQGWCTEDHQYLMLNDEADEFSGTDKRTHTYLWDIRDLENPIHFGDYYAQVNSIDHNLYVKGDLVFESNYGSGLRVLDISEIAAGTLEEIAYFDTHPEVEDGVEFTGVWSSYVYFNSGYIAVSSVERGIFLLELNPSSTDTPQDQPTISPPTCDSRCPIQTVTTFPNLIETISTPPTFCLSRLSTVQLPGKGLITMEDLKVGDKILINDTAMWENRYEMVFMFGHANAYAESNFLEICTEGNINAGLLEVSREHLVFKNGSIHPVPASTLQVGDFVLNGEGKAEKVIHIESLKRQGIYSPLVKSGFFLAGGAKISSYTTVSNSGLEEESQFVRIGNQNMISYHSLQHVAISPYRVLLSVGFDSLCAQRNWEGQLLFVAIGEKLVVSLSGFGIASQAMASILFVVGIGPLYLLESVFSSSNSSKQNVILAVILFLYFCFYIWCIKK